MVKSLSLFLGGVVVAVGWGEYRLSKLRSDIASEVITKSVIVQGDGCAVKLKTDALGASIHVGRAESLASIYAASFGTGVLMQDPTGKTSAQLSISNISHLSLISPESKVNAVAGYDPSISVSGREPGSDHVWP